MALTTIQKQYSATALIWGLLLCFSLSTKAQSPLNTQKVVIYKDLSQITQKGILRFDKQRAEVELKINPIPESVEFRGTGEFKIAWYRFREEMVSVKMPAANWEEILIASTGRNITLVYQIGAEYDEVEGTVASVDENREFVILNSSRGTDFIIPMEQVRQVIVSNAGKLEVEKKVPRKMISIATEEDVPFVPVEMTCLHEGLSWEPICRIKLQNTQDALISSSALIRNEALNLEDVEVELSASNAMSPAAGNSGATSLGKLTLAKGEYLTVNLESEEVDYEEFRMAEIPWKGIGPSGNGGEVKVEHLLSFELPEVSGLHCTSASVLDPTGRQIANLEIPRNRGGKSLLSLGEDDKFTVNYSETVKKEGKTVKIGSREYVKKEIEGTITISNSGKSYFEIFLKREISGDMENPGNGTLSSSEKPGCKWITWKLTVGGGEKKGITYQYEALIPVEN